MSIKIEVITPVKNFVLSGNDKVLLFEGRNYIKRNNKSGNVVIEGSDGLKIILHKEFLSYSTTDKNNLSWNNENLFKVLETFYTKNVKDLSLGLLESTPTQYKVAESFDTILIPPIYFIAQ